MDPRSFRHRSWPPLHDAGRPARSDAALSAVHLRRIGLVVLSLAMLAGSVAMPARPAWSWPLGRVMR